ncbi:hypothetical protein GCM10020220_084950 [Nonomuraea rubra]
MTVTGIDFVALQVRDLERAAAFYEKHLGLVRNPAAPPHAVVFATEPIAFAVREPLPGVELPERPGAGVALWLKAGDAQRAARRPPGGGRADRDPARGRPLRADVQLRGPRGLRDHDSRSLDTAILGCARRARQAPWAVGSGDAGLKYPESSMGTPSLSSPLAELQSRLPDLMPRDQRRLRRRLDGMRRVRSRDARDKIAAEILADLERAEQRLVRRREAVPVVKYPENLPVSQRKDDILEAIRDHQVVIIAGETGSGKTTQIPKICLELGRGVRGLIGHTQPRRIAARTVAERIAEELGTGLGEVVGYKVRFTDQASDRTLVKLMTDGILLAELQNDRLLDQYDTLIIDEAHERSLNIDFILGYLKQLLPQRPDLKVVITSATIDPERFSRHFDDAPIIEVSGRTYPVEVRYRPLEEDDDQTQGIVDACRELIGEGPGDILVFLSGEREIRDAADALAKAEFRNTEILPLYARLSAAEQHRVFQRHTGRRIVLATNVAETSLTVPGIKYVVDPGFARISRYSHRTKVQRLPIEPISQASANQRKGRSGRTSDGICIRLYEEEDFLGRPEFTDPEILRTNLASVILQMTSIGLGDIEAFPFVEPPDRRQVKDGVNLLHELGAFDAQNKLTGVGRKLAQLPVDPRLGRMVLEAEKNGCLREVMVIAAALSIQDPRERPSDKQQQARRETPPLRRPRVRLPGLPQPVELPAREAAGAVLQRVPAVVQGRVPQLPARTRVAGHLQPGTPVARRPAQQRPGRPVPRARLAARRPAVAHRRQGRHGEARRRRPQADPGVPGRPATPASPSSPARHWPRSSRSGSCRPSSWRPPACGPGSTPRSSPTGSSRSRSTSSSAPTPSRTGRKNQGAVIALGEGHPVRRAAGHRPQGQLRPHRPRPVARAVHQARAGRGRLGHPPPVPQGQPPPARRGRGTGEPRPPPRHHGGRRGPVRLLRPAGAGRGGLGPPLRLLVEEGQAGAARPCSRSRRRCWSTRAPTSAPATTPTPGNSSASGCG